MTTLETKVLKALAVFCDGREPAWLRLLRPGFRHVFVALNDGDRWIVMDPLSPHTDLTVPPVGPEFDLAGWFRHQGLVVAEAAVHRNADRAAPWGPFTCVEAVKRVLGLHAPLILTPWQLYRHLTATAAGQKSLPFGDPPMARRRSAARAPDTPALPPSGQAPAQPPGPIAPRLTQPALPPPADLDAPTAGERSLLQRAAGRAGTVLTSWRGLFGASGALETGSLAPARKSLLGE